MAVAAAVAAATKVNLFIPSHSRRTHKCMQIIYDLSECCFKQLK